MTAYMDLILSINIQALLVFSIAFTLTYIFFRRDKSIKLPPGPFSLPIVGTLPWLGTDIREPLENIKRKYGDVFTVYLGSRRVVMLSSYEAIKEAFVKYGHLFIGRPQDLFFISEITLGNGIISSEGKLWKELRKFGHNVFREFGVGKSIFEAKIQEELVFFINRLKDNSKAFDPQNAIVCAVSNVISNIVYGSRFEYTDEVFIKNIEILNKTIEILGNSAPLTAFPGLKYLPGDPFKYKWIKKTNEFVVSEDAKRVAEHRKTFTPGVVRDIIDAFLVAMENNKDNKNSLYTDKQLLAVIGDLFGAGTETTATTLRWGLVYMLLYPDVQAKVQKEIHDVIGYDKYPSMQDKANLPFTEACILEIQRMGDIVPLGVPHTVTEDIVFRNFDIPKGTTVMANLYSVHRDPNIWQDPYKFNPDRFLDKNGKVYRRELIIPFSMGKRVCLGESLARMELFLFFTSINQKFTFANPPGQSLAEIDKGHFSITYAPKGFKVIFKPSQPEELVNL